MEREALSLITVEQAPRNKTGYNRGAPFLACGALFRSAANTATGEYGTADTSSVGNSPYIVGFELRVRLKRKSCMLANSGTTVSHSH